MTTLNWSNWLRGENCIKAEGENLTWIVAPSRTDGPWKLFNVPNDSETGDSVSVGVFHSMTQALAAAQRAEHAWSEVLGSGAAS